MTSDAIHRALWEIRHSPSRFGFVGFVGIALIGVAIVFAAVRLPWAYNRLATLEQSSATLQQRLQRATGSFDDAARSPAEQLGEFYGAFPQGRNVANLLDALYQSAGKHGITLYQGEYRAKQERESPLIRYQITLPVSGHYLRLREFVREALTRVPFLALDNISVARGKINEPVVEARVQFTLYMIGTPP